MPKAIEIMRKREQEILKTILHLSEKTNGFTNPKLMMIGGYALRAFIRLSRFTRDCDFAMRKKNGWNIDELKIIMPSDYLVEEIEKRDGYGFLRSVKFLKQNNIKIKISMDFMEGEIRGRKPDEVILIDEAMVKNRKLVEISISDQPVKIAVPDYVDYFIMKVVSSRASDIRDIASLVHEKNIPPGLKKRVEKILPYPELFEIKIKKKIIPEIKRRTFLDSWKGIFGTQRYTEEDKKMVMARIERLN